MPRGTGRAADDPFPFLCPPVRYDYRCLDCWARVTPPSPAPGPPEPYCPACGGSRIVRLVPGPSQGRSRNAGPHRLVWKPRPRAGGERNGGKGG